MKRRALLAGLTGLSAGSTAGCLHVLGSPSASIGNLALINEDTDPRVFHIEIERYGTTVATLSKRVDGADDENREGNAVVSGDWGKPGRYDVTVRVADARGHVAMDDDDCNDIVISYSSGRLGFFTDLYDDGCSS
ncbi:hypothetical protein [Haladaptatus sp. CMAA 1911]|uniref:hypothetical protein n=1 Tax=unclassified Haladaptatus TaxID=2622732 RepID=UPI003754AA44